MTYNGITAPWVQNTYPGNVAGGLAIQETVTFVMTSPGRGTPRPIEIPRRIGNVRLGEMLGQGATGVVFAGYDDVLKRKVAVKVLHRIGAGDMNDELARFIEGVRAAAAVKHANILTVHAVDTVAGMPLIVMEHVDGLSLRELIGRAGPFDASLAAYAIQEIAAGVEALHAARIVHRDIKPANVLLDRDGRTHICDFGLACQLAAASGVRGAEGVSGTPLYMSPEMFDGVVSPQSDVYALGVILFELLSGRPPFSADTMDGMKACHSSEPLPVERLASRQVPDELVEAIVRATHKTRIMRYKTAGHFARAIAAVALPERRAEALRMRLATVIAAVPAAQGTQAAGQESGQPGDTPRGGQAGESSRVGETPPALARTMFDLVARRAQAKRGEGRDGRDSRGGE